ncbi:MAG: flagellar basal-body MS-ring/collar protein FliF, partial [Terriglobales bacterium]
MSLSLNPINSMQSLRQARSQAGTFLQGMTPRQRLLLGGAVVAVVAGLALFVHFMGKPPGAVLYSGLDPADAQQVATQLGALGVPYEISADNASITVPASQLDRARLQMAARGLPHSGQLGFEIFDKTNWSGSDFAEQVNYQRALEGELERTIETIHGVQGARVHITMAHDSLFTSEEREAKAAVLLTLGAGRMDPDMVGAI